MSMPLFKTVTLALLACGTCAEAMLAIISVPYVASLSYGFNIRTVLLLVILIGGLWMLIALASLYRGNQRSRVVVIRLSVACAALIFILGVMAEVHRQHTLIERAMPAIFALAVIVGFLSIALVFRNAVFVREMKAASGEDSDNGPNKAADSTASAGTSAAGQPRAPASPASHL
jgi:4-amino-4-deoxy-L-arabinose transferase-like glycosyltransferase